MRVTRALFLTSCGAALLATLSLTAQDQPGTAKGKAKGKGPPGANHPERMQVLIITGQNPHDWRATTPSLRKTLDDTQKFETRVIEEFRGSGPEILAPYDVVIVNYYDGNNPKNRWGERAETGLSDFVRSGKGLVLYHLSLGAFDGWTDYEKMSGGNWRPNQGHHSPQHDYPLDIKDPEHPIMSGFKTPLMIKNDELFANLRWQPAGSYHVLATAYDDHSRYGAQDKQTKVGAGTDEPILWTTEFGKGRVFNIALGHGPEDTENPEFKAIFMRGVEWATTGKVTIPVPPEFAK
jgi:type 1 glutamine amidotransferase